ncbi:MAG: leucine-rich repeat domain-containing protein, partial [Clostridia bacterium]|nr:leucine-rich repeat domain-containing protein [Clostridia bacterium]
MKNNKTTFSITLCAVTVAMAVLASTLSGCSGKDKNTDKEETVDNSVNLENSVPEETADNDITLENPAPEREKNPVPEEYAEDACGENLTWRFDENTATLYIEGEGDMWDFVYWDEDEQEYYREDAPWCNIRRSIKEINISDGVTSIGDYAFYYCDFLASIEIPDSVTSIGDYAFSYCRSLTSIEIPDSVTSIGVWAFAGCTSLESIDVDSDNKYYCDKAGVLLSKDKKILVCYPAGKTDTEYA